MGIICIWPRHKNPVIKCEHKQPKHQKPQKTFVRKLQRKCMKNVIKMKKEGYLGLTYAWGQNPLKIWGRKQQGSLDWIGRERKGRKR